MLAPASHLLASVADYRTAAIATELDVHDHAGIVVKINFASGANDTSWLEVRNVWPALRNSSGTDSLVDRVNFSVSLDPRPFMILPLDDGPELWLPTPSSTVTLFNQFCGEFGSGAGGGLAVYACDTFVAPWPRLLNTKMRNIVALGPTIGAGAVLDTDFWYVGPMNVSVRSSGAAGYEVQLFYLDQSTFVFPGTPGTFRRVRSDHGSVTTAVFPNYTTIGTGRMRLSVGNADAAAKVFQIDVSPAWGT